MADVRQFPIQIAPGNGYRTQPGKVPEAVYMRAYEVYSHVHAPQEAMIDLERGCRGGFSTGEMIAFLYASAFPKDQWQARTDEAMRGMSGL